MKEKSIPTTRWQREIFMENLFFSEVHWYQGHLKFYQKCLQHHHNNCQHVVETKIICINQILATTIKVLCSKKDSNSYIEKSVSLIIHLSKIDGC